MSDVELPFYTQAALLDQYMQTIDPQIDAKIIDVILEMLRSKPDLRDYFFRNRPNYIWAQILWDNGFLTQPPEPQKSKEGIEPLPRWDVQEFLISVAEEVPDIVIKHVESIQGHGWYISRALIALCKISPEQSKILSPRIVDWLNIPNVAGIIAREAHDFVIELTNAGEIDSALPIIKALSKPVFRSEFKNAALTTHRGEPIVILYEDVLIQGYQDVDILSVVVEVNPKAISKILYSHLGDALKMETQYLEQVDYDKTSWWRVAVEETGQDRSYSAKDKLLNALLRTLECWVTNDPQTFFSMQKKLLADDRSIFYRVGLYLLHMFPDSYKPLVIDELGKTDNLDNTEIHHEYFLLLASGYPKLPKSNQRSLIQAILAGPPKDKLSEVAKYASEEFNVDVKNYMSEQTDLWKRDRLWMIRDHLTGNTNDILRELVDNYGIPEHPTFTRWMSGGGWIQSISPLSDDELSQLSPKQLMEFLIKWEPESNQPFGFEEVNYEGLAKSVSDLVIGNLDKYKSYINSIAIIKPIFASTLLREIDEADSVHPNDWKIYIELCERILDDDDISSGKDWRYSPNWVWVRQCIARLINSGFQKESHHIPTDLLPRARDILLILIDDPDPVSEPEPELNKLSGFKDPLTVSLNHVRPVALTAIMEYLKYRVQKRSPEERFEIKVRDALTRKLSHVDDRSKSVHSIFGRFFSTLYWLDSEWVNEHLDKIFPTIEDAESFWFFISAWDSFIFSHKYLPFLMDILLPKYLVAVELLSRGLVTRPDVIGNFAIHIILDYLLNDYGDDLLGNNLVPVGRLYLIGRPEDKAQLAWACWRVCQGNPDKSDDFWPKIKSLWEMRVNECSLSNHTSDFDQEMIEFAHLLDVAPENETIITLWPLLEGMLPHIVNVEDYVYGWDSFERFLSREVENNPVQSVQFYRVMREHKKHITPWKHESNEGRRIIELGAANESSRKETLSLVDMLARSGNFEYRDIYDRYAG
jgi:hypothetical protein